MTGLPRQPALRRMALIPLLALTLSAAPDHSADVAPRPPLVGFSFTPGAAQYANLDPLDSLTTLLDRVEPDLVRLPVYWQAVAPTPVTLDYSPVDGMLDRVRRHNRTTARQTRVILVEGARNLGYPEFYVPSWVTWEQQRDVPAVLGTEAYRRYMTQTVARYRSDPLLYSWQIENEPFDNVVSGAPGDVTVAVTTVGQEVAQARRLDPRHPAVVTSYNSSTLDLDEIAISPFARLYASTPVAHPTGHPQAALDAGDVLGLDVYVATPSTAPSSGAVVAATPGLTVTERVRWKKDVIDYWSQRAVADAKQMWIMEMQSGSWHNDDSFTQRNLMESATDYADGSTSVILLWGVETWLVSPSWMSTGLTAVNILRGADPDESISV